MSTPRPVSSACLRRLAALSAVLLALPAARAQPATFLVNDARDGVSLVTSDPRVCDVDAVHAGDQCTLEAALYLASGLASGSQGATIGFDLPGDGLVLNVRTRHVFAARVVLDGTTQRGHAGRPLVTINAPLSDAGTTPFLSFNGPGSAVRGLAFQYVDDTVVALNGGQSRLEGCYIGLDATGAPPLIGYVTGNGVLVNSDGNTVGGPGPLGNVVARRGGFVSGLTAHGIVVYGNDNRIENNVVGLDPAGTTALGNNGSGIVLTYGASRNVVSGNLIAANRDFGVLVSGGLPTRVATANRLERNVIGLTRGGTSAPTGTTASTIQAGVYVYGGPDGGGSAEGTVVGPGNVVSGNRVGVWIAERTRATRVVGNRIGLDAGTGTTLVANTVAGVHVTGGGVAARIGGAGDADRNTIAGGSYGVLLENPRFDPPGNEANVVSGNWIGLDASGTQARPATVGVLSARRGDVIGADSSSGRGNVISGNRLDGIVLGRLSGDVRVYGNRIGTTPDGLHALPNDGNGVSVQGSGGHRIGGAEPWQGNVLSGNRGRGLLVEGSSVPGTTTDDTRVEGNLIGLAADGIARLGNGASGTAGAEVRAGAAGVVVGGTALGAGNAIGGNPTGLAVQDVDGLRVVGNRIGIGRTGEAAPNGIGVVVASATNLALGGTATGEANRIQSNAGHGIQVIGTEARASRGVAMLSNAFGGNGGLGIDLRPTNGLSQPVRTPNDAGDGDEGFANRGMNTPLLVSASLAQSTGLLTLRYRLETPVGPAATYPIRVQVYAADGDEATADEGTVLLGTDTYTETDWAAGGLRTAVFSVATELFSGGTLIATATDADGNTSEFSDAVKINNTSVAAEAAPVVPTVWALGSPVPHPARSGSRVTIAVPTSAPTRLGVVDLLGREIAVLIDATLAPGTHTVVLPELASGAYVLRLTGDGHVQTRAFVVAPGAAR